MSQGTWGRVGGVSRTVRFARYSAGSVLASAVSAVVFALAYHFGHTGPRIATLAAFLSGAVVNFVAGRFWAWRRRGPGLGRDAFGYALVAVSTAVAAGATTTVTEWYAQRLALTDLHRTVAVEAAYFATYGAVFVVKFVLLDRVVFARAPATRS